MAARRPRRAVFVAPVGAVAWFAGLLACSPAPPPKPAVSELVVPPIGDAGARVIVHAAPPPPREPPPKSAEELEREECRRLMLHLVRMQFAASGMAPQQQQELIDGVVQSLDTSNLCAVIDEGTRRCMFAAATMADVGTCGGGLGAPTPAPPPPKPSPRKKPSP